ncbi:MAG: carbohydrate ABC transporter permease [Clostridiales bacterium]|jgi:putative aldouronate transport system permease protein|nr:carbohydrate ABC transporter permease [Clostridiales bacterium]
MKRQKEKTALTHINNCAQDKVFMTVLYVVLALVLIVVIYPLLFVVFASMSDPQYVNSGALLLYPKGFNLLGYQQVFRDQRILIGYGNTIYYTVFGTILAVAVNMMGGYALSRDDLPGRGIVMALFVFTMYFGGGMIPFYLIVRNLHLTNTRTILVLLGGTSVYNMIIARSFFISTIPRELQEAAEIDGCGTGRFFFSIVMPLSKAITAVIVLYCAVGQWNAYFNALIFISDRDKFPLQIFLREILLTAKTYESADVLSTLSGDDLARMQRMSEVTKYGVIVVSTLPIIALYPFLQKYFVKGVMIGSLKG